MSEDRAQQGGNNNSRGSVGTGSSNNNNNSNAPHYWRLNNRCGKRERGRARRRGGEGVEEDGVFS